MSELTISTQQKDEEHPRSRIIDSYLATIDKSIQENRPQIKLINYGTGSGKTHLLFQAICETIKKESAKRIIGVYVAPLREHLQVPKEIKDQYGEEIPIYKLNSRDMKTTEDLIKEYKKWIPSILANKEFWKNSTNCPREKVQEAQSDLYNVKKVIRQFEYVKQFDLDIKQSETEKIASDLNNAFESFLEFLVKFHPDESTWPAECVSLMEIFMPLHLLRDKSGILLLTYDKFETLIPYFRRRGDSWVRKNDYLDKYIIEHTNDATKFIVAFDEQEDGYQILLKHKIDIISPKSLAVNNALSSINRELALLFSPESPKNRQLLGFLSSNPGAFYEFREHFEKGKTIDPKLQPLAPIYQQLTVGDGNSVNFLSKVAEFYEKLQKSVKEIAEIFIEYEEDHSVSLDFEMLARVFSKFENNRSLLIPQTLYSSISAELMNIFAYNNVYIYNIEPLKKLYLARTPGGHVQITENAGHDSPSVAELIYAILAVRLLIKDIREFLSKVLESDDSQSRSLHVWSQQIEKAQRISEDGAMPSKLIKYLDRKYVYQSYKSIINITEISRYQSPANNLIDPSNREVSIGNTAIMASPEHRIISMVSNGSNVIFLVSATGGVVGDLSTSYDMHYLEDILRDESGESTFGKMTESELALSEEIREFRATRRKITVDFFTEDLSSFPNFSTWDAINDFEKWVLKDFINSFEGQGWHGLGIYKVQELNNFVRFLFYLFEDNEINEIIAFTQTIRWIKGLVNYCAQLHHRNFIFELSQENPNVCYVQVRHPKYTNPLQIKLILYESKFNSLYNNEAVEKSYMNELKEKDGQKIFFISAYQSASKGLNPTIETVDGQQKDFDALALLMDSYYTSMGPALYKADDEGREVTAFHFALMKSIVFLGDSNLLIKDFNEYLSRPEAREFQERQHEILLGKGILQAIGRTERRDSPNQVVKIFINEETQKNLVNFYRYLVQQEPDELRKLSVNNHRVYLRVQEEEKKRTIQDYDEHVYDEIAAYHSFQKFRKWMLHEIDELHTGHTNSAIIETWNALRDPMAFDEPAQFVENLNATGLFPVDFSESLFYLRAAQPEFVPYVATVEDKGKKFQIISDSANGEKVYPYLNRLFPDYLKTVSRGYDLEGNEVVSQDPSTDLICRLYRKLVPQPDIFKTHIPRPQFFYDVLFPSLAEHFTERWIQDAIFEGKDWRGIKVHYGFEQLRDFVTYNKLYELFDLFYVRKDTLYCIDVKAWSMPSGNRLSQKAVAKAQRKLESITKEYPEFSAVRGLLLNLHALEAKSHHYAPNLFSGNLIFFNEYRFPVESSVLRDFLFAKEK